MLAGVIATPGDDWAKYHSHFPPLFPLLLVITAGAQSYLAAHLTVAVCTVVALAFVYRFAALLFLLSPSAWIQVSGILSVPLAFAALWLALRLEPEIDNYRLTLRLVLDRG